MVGFGSLMIASHQGLQSLGRVLTIGVSCCLFTSLVMLPAQGPQPEPPPDGLTAADLVHGHLRRLWESAGRGVGEVALAVPGFHGSEATVDSCLVYANWGYRGGAVTLPDVGKIYCRERPARMVRNPATGEQIKKEADKVVKMTIAKALKDSVNG